MSGGPLGPALFAGSAAALVLAGRAFATAPRAPRPFSGARPLARRPAGRRLGERLARAGIPLGPDAFAALVGAAALAAAALAWGLVRLPILAPAAAAAVLLGARALVGSADSRYLARVARQLPGIADQLSGALGAGLSLRQAIARAARDAPEPAAAELRRLAADLTVGARVEEALEAFAARLPDRDLGVMVTAILVQRRTGGDLARALGEIGARLEERARLARELRGATAQARLTAWLVAALPAVAGLAVEASAPGTLSRTLGHGPGLVLLLVAGSLEVVGVLVIRRIARIES